MPEHLHIEMLTVQKEIVLLESQLALLRPSSSDERTSLRRHHAYFLLLLLLTALLLLYVFALPYLRLRLSAEATLWQLPPPASTHQLQREVVVYTSCGEAFLSTRYQTDRTWSELDTYYRTTFYHHPGWSYQSYQAATVGVWNFDPRDDELRPSLKVTIGRLLPSDTLLLPTDDERPGASGGHSYRVDIEYINDQRAYHKCHPD